MTHHGSWSDGTQSGTYNEYRRTYYEQDLSKEGHGRVGTALGSYTYHEQTTIDTGGSMNGVAGTPQHSVESHDRGGAFQMTEESLTTDGGGMDWQCNASEVEGPPPPKLDAKALAYVRSLADGSDAFRTLDQVDGLFAGWADRLTGGLSTRARAALWGYDATRNHHSDAFRFGQRLGTAHSLALSFVNPCALGGLGWGLRAINAASAVGNILVSVRRTTRRRAIWALGGGDQVVAV